MLLLGNAAFRDCSQSSTLFKNKLTTTDFSLKRLVISYIY